MADEHCSLSPFTLPLLTPPLIYYHLTLSSDPFFYPYSLTLHPLTFTGEKIVMADEHCSLFYIIVGGEVVVEKKHRPPPTSKAAKGERVGGPGTGLSPRGGRRGSDFVQHKDKGQVSRPRRDKGQRRGSDHLDNASVSESPPPQLERPPPQHQPSLLFFSFGFYEHIRIYQLDHL